MTPLVFSPLLLIIKLHLYHPLPLNPNYRTVFNLLKVSCQRFIKLLNQKRQVMNNTISRIVIYLMTAPTTDSCEYLTEQLKGILDEAQDILQSQHSSPMKEETDGMKYCTDNKNNLFLLAAPSELTSSGGLRNSGNEKFQQWVAQFQNERASLKSKVVIKTVDNS